MSEPTSLAETYDAGEDEASAEPDELDKAALLKKLKSWFREDAEHDTDWRERHARLHHALRQHAAGMGRRQSGCRRPRVHRDQ